MRRALLLLAMFTLLSACGLRTWVDVSIAEDSSGVVTLQLASDQELREGMATFSPDADPVEQLSSGLQEQGWTIETAEPDGEWEGVVATHTFADLVELQGLLGEALQGGESALELTETEDGYSLSAELGPPAEGTEQADLFSQAADVIDLDGRLAITFPGEVTDTNGAVSTDRRTVTWTYDEESILGLAIQAEAEKPGPNIIALIGLLVVGTLTGVVAGVLLRRARLKREVSL